MPTGAEENGGKKSQLKTVSRNRSKHIEEDLETLTEIRTELHIVRKLASHYRILNACQSRDHMINASHSPIDHSSRPSQGSFLASEFTQPLRGKRA
jgi:hypothetical protein